ncbi:MAG: helix-turn-helix transcriptional regulator [Bacillota bacterium]
MVRYITLQEAAERLGVHRTTLYRWARGGRIPLYSFGPRSTRIKEEDLERLEEEARVVYEKEESGRDGQQDTAGPAT